MSWLKYGLDKEWMKCNGSLSPYQLLLKMHDSSGPPYENAVFVYFL